jgi:hypothetical protein
VIRGRPRALPAAAVALIAVLWSERARAAPDPDAARAPASAPVAHGPRVVLFTVTSDDPLAGRIDAELRALGFEVSRAAIAPEVDIEALVGRALAGGARGAVVADGHRTDVWIGDDGTGRVALRQELEVDETSGLQSVLALRTVEFLRISLGLGVSPVTPLPPTPTPTPTPVAVPAPVAPGRRGWWALDVSGGILDSAGRLGPLAIAGASLRAGLGGLFGLELDVYAPLSGTDLSDAGEQTRTTVWLAGAALLFAPPSERRWAFEAAGGTMALVVRSTGSPPPSGAAAAGGEDQAVGLALYGRGAVRLRLAARWSLRLDVLGGTALRRPVLVFSNGDTARWGTVFAAGLGGAEMRF